MKHTLFGGAKPRVAMSVQKGGDAVFDNFSGGTSWTGLLPNTPSQSSRAPPAYAPSITNLITNLNNPLYGLANQTSSDNRAYSWNVRR